MKMIPRLLSALLVPSSLVLASACSTHPVDLGGDYQISAIRARTVNPNIDVLFVVDDSGSMTEEVASIAGHAEAALFDIIGTSVGRDLNLHVGIITTDAGCGADGGDDGELQAGVGCLADAVPYLYDVDDGAGGRSRNAPTTTADALACMTDVGLQGCGFEQPLGALERLLARAEAGGDSQFLRPEALLFVVVITDEDDCTAQGGMLFDASEEPLGLRDSFRCFEHGVTCAEPSRELGAHTECEASPDDTVLRPIDHTLDALLAAKGGDASKVFFATISGGAGPVDVTTQGVADNNPDWFTLAPSCRTPGAEPDDPGAAPAIRLHDMVQRMPGHAWEESICSPDLATQLTRTGNAVGDIAGQRACLHGDLIDVDAATTGIQASCRAFAQLGAATTAPIELPACADAEQGQACFSIDADTAKCGHTSSALRATMWANDEADYETALVTFECLTPASIAGQ